MAVLVFGVLMVIGGLLGMRVFTLIGSVLAIGTGGMWIGLVAHHFSTPQLPNSYYLNPANLPVVYLARWSMAHYLRCRSWSVQHLRIAWLESSP